LEAEAASGNADAAQELRKELALMRDKVDTLHDTLKGKEEELKLLKERSATNQEASKASSSVFILSSSSYNSSLWNEVMKL